MPRKNKVLKVGEQAPLFALPSADRQMVSLEAYRGQKHVILVFFRGTW